MSVQSVLGVALQTVELTEDCLGNSRWLPVSLPQHIVSLDPLFYKANVKFESAELDGRWKDPQEPSRVLP